MFDFIKSRLSFKEIESQETKDLYIHVNVLIKKTEGSDFQIHEWYAAKTMARYIRSLAPEKTVFVQGLFSPLYSIGGVDWAYIKIGSSPAACISPDIFSYDNIVANDDEIITCNESLITFEYIDDYH